jgi:hypothetical protein
MLAPLHRDVVALRWPPFNHISSHPSPPLHIRRWVRDAAAAQLGPFLHALSSSGKPLPPALVTLYLR